MSGIFDSTAPRFFRPSDVARIQRNQRRINTQRAVRLGRNGVLALALVALGIWAYQRVQSDARFAVRTIEVGGVVHTSRAELDAVTSAYAGKNLFKIDIARVQAAMRSLPWVSRVEVEKKLPDTLRIRIVERNPEALVRIGNELRYADETGVPFAPLSPAAGDPDLPLIVAGDRADLQRCTELVRDLRRRDPLLYSRISEVRPMPPHAFALFDRDLGAVVYTDARDLSEKWRTLYAIAQSERFGRAAIEYADLRFADRIVLKPVHPIHASAAAIVPAQSAEITN
ncbi:MAG TPA: FtsQ-type POTRA domain-containing protein [Thermoanaerobaculia bacterium]|nr:FtsQ-type POTRA domain-containing protein [Thermoanaerobaculia bacterium]